MTQIKKGFCYILCTICLVWLAGCWDLNELNELTIVSGIAVDKGDKRKYKITVEGVNATELSQKNPGVGGTAPSVTFSQEGDNLAEILKRINVGFSRKIILSHMQLLVISNKVAEEGIGDLMDFLLRDREVRNDFSIVIVKKNKAQEILEVSYPFQKVSSFKVRIQLDSIKADWGGAPGVRLHDLIDAVYSTGKTAAITTVGISGNPEKGEKMSNMHKIKPDARIILTGLSIFRDRKLVGQLSLQDTRNYLIVANKLDRTTLEVPCSKKGSLGIRLYNAVSDIQANYKSGRPDFQVAVAVDSFLDSTSCQADLTKIETYEKYEKKIAKYIEGQLMQTIEKTQKKKSDIFGFGDKMSVQQYKKFKKVEKKWNEEFAKAKVNVTVSVKLRRSGLITKPLRE